MALLVSIPNNLGGTSYQPFRVVHQFFVGEDLDTSQMGVERAEGFVARFLGHF
jgi:hypothetical protein